MSDRIARQQLAEAIAEFLEKYDPADTLRPLTGRELNEQHKALVEAGVDPLWVLRWLGREVDRWLQNDGSGS